MSDRANAPSWDALKKAAPLAFPGALLLVKRRSNGTGVARLRYDGEGRGFHTDEMELEWTSADAESDARLAIDGAIVGLAKGWAEIAGRAS